MSTTGTPTITPARSGSSAATDAATYAPSDIPYSTARYSITYKSSENLQAANGTIHKNYNGWIQNLTRGINAQLSAS